MIVEFSYCVFALLALAVFRVLPPSRAVLAVFFTGWLVLPVGNYPAEVPDSAFAYWITGLATPSSMLLTKAWVAPAAAVLGAIVFDRGAFTRLRATWADAPVILWCLWPLLQSAFVEGSRPGAGVASLYLAGCWALPWLLGRLYFDTPPGRVELAKALALSGVALLPIGLIEGVVGPVVYEMLYGAHPFVQDGASRYLGYRPLGFFENGNQYGIWISLCALAALWVALSTGVRDSARRNWQLVALVSIAMAIAAQSVGGILLATAGGAVLYASRFLRLRMIAAASLALMALGSAVYISGVVPIERLARETTLGRATVEAFEKIDRGSFTWRIARDQDLLPAATAHPISGTGQWDWWREHAVRPWGLALLLIGQFGIIGMGLAFVTLAGTAFATAWRAPPVTAWRSEAAPLLLAVVVALTAIDAILNSFLFFPALLAAGALARRQGE